MKRYNTTRAGVNDEAATAARRPPPALTRFVLIPILSALRQDVFSSDASHLS
ncbi:MAG: hypothetical protein H0W76_02145 [Pyrinomonadaceae bacterium]|nr:hypothetical protein [Pyrinomonadaceae bacterium]